MMYPAPLVFTRPKSAPFDAEVMDPRAKPGDICNRYGDIRGADRPAEHAVIKAGVVYVTPEQAEKAKAHGWELWEEQLPGADLVRVVRN